MANKSRTNAVQVQGPQTRSSSKNVVKPVKPANTAQLATPPPESGTTDTDQAHQGDTDKE
jgi:hypothetical protein